MLPKGRAWARHAGASILELLAGTLYEFARVEERSDEFSTEMDPTQTSALLPEWESALGLPGECTAPTTEGGRRAAIVTRLTDSGTNTEAAISAAVAAFDSGTSVDAFVRDTQFEVGSDGGGAGQPVGADEWAHTVTILIDTTNLTLDTVALECIVDEIKRAHGHYIYTYNVVNLLTEDDDHLTTEAGDTLVA